MKNTTTNATRTRRDELTEVQTQLIPFGIRDAKGREFGIEIRTNTTAFGPFNGTEGEFEISYNHTHGNFFSACVQTTRDGHSFGASQDWNYFTTEDARTAYISKRLGSARKAATKKAGK